MSALGSPLRHARSLPALKPGGAQGSIPLTSDHAQPRCYQNLLSLPGHHQTMCGDYTAWNRTGQERALNIAAPGPPSVPLPLRPLADETQVSVTRPFQCHRLDMRSQGPLSPTCVLGRRRRDASRNVLRQVVTLLLITPVICPRVLLSTGFTRLPPSSQPATKLSRPSPKPRHLIYPRQVFAPNTSARRSLVLSST
ncbi:hypothetical protein EJ04DRAFT_53852 [Polyplosphaeria fusca]|uniref:Uncharacterized protein n=1 Tax=Polyplosphaeria fusca TaxID=682080 RepID=A0A9P4QR13_9PLEO|nr:hypothetical protein EJ04DRAFT_53852 [Polyplosphaeria fusca]